MQLEVPPPGDRVLGVGVSREGGDCSRPFGVGRELGRPRDFLVPVPGPRARGRTRCIGSR